MSTRPFPWSRRECERRRSIDSGPEDSLAIGETGQFFGVKEAARRMNFTRQLRGVVIVETKEYTRTHAKDGCSHMGRKLFPELLAGGYADTVLARLRNEREHIGTHQVLELVRVNGE